MQKKEVGLLLYSIEKLVDHTPKFKNYNYKLLEENTGVNLCNLRLSDSFFFLNTILKVQMKKKKISWATSNYKHLCCKCYHQKNENTMHRMGENISYCKSYI